jgi:hypothetical protein
MLQVVRHGLIVENKPAPDVPVDVLALPRRRLDWRVLLRLPDWEYRMSTRIARMTEPTSIPSSPHGSGAGEITQLSTAT